MLTSLEELVACNSDLNKHIKTLTVPIAMSVFSISNSCASVFGGNDPEMF